MYRFLASASVVIAAAATPSVAAAQQQTYEFNIPAQDLSAAVRKFAEVTKQQITFGSEAVDGKRSTAVVGRYSAEAALRMMLKDTGVDYRVAGQNVIVLQAAAAAQGAAGDFSGAEVAVGKVVDENTGANLKGAIVELEGTGRTTSTDELGRFRFPGLRPGVYRVRVSFLGYQDVYGTITVDGGEEPTTFAMYGGGPDNPILVYGSRSARSQALNQERSAENVSTVISSDLLGDFVGTTLSESLRRAPAVVFDRDPETGEGANIGIRGLSPDYNAVTFNGIELPEGSGTGRSASLANILTESISSVTINKTLLPSMNSAGTGGLVEITTKTPLDRPHRYASFTVEGARRDKSFNDDFLVAGTLSGTFGSDDQFGLSASVQYREHDQRRISYSLGSQEGLFLPLQVDGTATITNKTGINPLLAFPFEEGADKVYVTSLNINDAINSSETFGVTLSGAWAMSDSTKLFLDYQRLSRRGEDYSTNYGLSNTLIYLPTPVQALGGEVRRTLASFSPGRVFASSSYYYSPDSKNDSDVLTFRGETDTGPWSFNYSAGYTKGQTSRSTYRFVVGAQNEVLGAEDLLPEATDPVEGRVVSIFPERLPGDDSFLDPLLTPEGFEALNNLQNYNFSSVNYSRIIGRNTRYKADFSSRYEFSGGALQYLEAGAFYNSSKFSDATPFITRYFPIGTRSLSDYGLSPSISSLDAVGVQTQIKQLPAEDAIEFMTSTVPGLAAECVFQFPIFPIYLCPDGAEFRIDNASEFTDPRLLEEFTKEEELAGYLQGSVKVGKFSIVGGARLTRVKVASTNLSGPRLRDIGGLEDIEFALANNTLVSESATQTELLPRFLANFRPSDNKVFRLGYYLSVARPRISDLSQSPQILLQLDPTSGPDGNQPFLQVFKGNPDLSPARTHNFDFSAEFYDNSAGVIKIGAFYKRTLNLLENNFENGVGALADVADLLPDDPRFQDVIANPEDYFIRVVIPNNAEDPAHIWGVEASVERRFTFLPGALSGLGVYANYTYTDSSKTQKITWDRSPVLDDDGNVIGFESVELSVPNVRYNGQAKGSGSIGLTYNKYGVDANVAYTWQDRRQTSYQNFNLGNFEEAYGTLDARFEYRFPLGPSNIRVFVEGSDLLRGPASSALRTTFGADDGVTPKYFDGATYFGGREFRAGMTATF